MSVSCIIYLLSIAIAKIKIKRIIIFNSKNLFYLIKKINFYNKLRVDALFSELNKRKNFIFINFLF